MSTPPGEVAQAAPDAAAEAVDAAPGKPPVGHWLLLVVAIISEVAATSLLKSTEGFTRLWPSIIVFCLYEVSFLVLVVVVKRIAVSVVYAIWGGSGVALVTIVAWIWLDQPMDLWGIVGIGLIMAGVVVMNGFSETTHA